MSQSDGNGQHGAGEKACLRERLLILEQRREESEPEWPIKSQSG